MKTLFLYVLAFVASVPLCMGCDSQAVLTPAPIEDFQLTFVSGNVTADLMPITPPDPLYCMITLAAENRNAKRSFTDITIPSCEVALESTGKKLGTFSFQTSWDGHIEPMECDTVKLLKITSPEKLFEPPCNQYVSLSFLVRNVSGSSRVLKVDSLLCGCVY